MDSLCQLSECTGLDDVLPILKVSDGALGNSRPARQKFGGELFRFGSDFVEIFGVNYSFVLAERFMRWVQASRFGHHGQIRPARPARRGLLAYVMKLPRDNMPAHKQADCLARACTAIGS